MGFQKIIDGVAEAVREKIEDLEDEVDDAIGDLGGAIEDMESAEMYLTDGDMDYYVDALEEAIDVHEAGAALEAWREIKKAIESAVGHVRGAITSAKDARGTLSAMDDM